MSYAERFDWLAGYSTDPLDRAYEKMREIAGDRFVIERLRARAADRAALEKAGK